MININNKRKILTFVLIVATLLCSCSSMTLNHGEKVVSEEKSEEVAEYSKDVQSEESEEEQSSFQDISESVSQIYDTPEKYIRYGIADAVEKVADSVVSISVKSRYSGSFYGDYMVEETGSGVIISESGHIATNCHVVEEADSITVFLADGTEYAAEIIGKDAKTDLAVIKINASENLIPATFSDASNLRAGDFVFAIGTALGKYQGSVTMGIVSALSREVTVNGESMKMIQTDAALNSGNSGGGLFDSHGYLVGIVAAKDSDSDSECVGFAVPSDVAKTVLTDIITHGYVTGRPTLGFVTVDITSMREAAYYGVDWIGVYISSVSVGSNSETSGLRSRDYIYSVNGEVIATSDRLEEILESSKIGDTLLLEVWRGKDSIDVILVIEEDTGK